MEQLAHTLQPTGCIRLIRHAAQTLPDVYWVLLREVCGTQKLYSMPPSCAP